MGYSLLQLCISALFCIVLQFMVFQGYLCVFVKVRWLSLIHTLRHGCVQSCSMEKRFHSHTPRKCKLVGCWLESLWCVRGQLFGMMLQSAFVDNVDFNASGLYDLSRMSTASTTVHHSSLSLAAADYLQLKISHTALLRILVLFILY